MELGCVRVDFWGREPRPAGHGQRGEGVGAQPSLAAWRQTPATPCPMQERVYEWLCKEYGSSEVLPTAALMDFLRQEALMLGQPGESSGAAAAQPPMPPAVFSSAVAAAKQGDVAEGADKLSAMPRRSSYPQSAPQLLALQHEQVPAPQFPAPPGWGNQ